MLAKLLRNEEVNATLVLVLAGAILARVVMSNPVPRRGPEATRKEESCY